MTGPREGGRLRLIALFRHQGTSYAEFYAHFRAVGYTKIGRTGQLLPASAPEARQKLALGACPERSRRVSPGGVV